MLAVIHCGTRRGSGLQQQLRCFGNRVAEYHQGSPTGYALNRHWLPPALPSGLCLSLYNAPFRVDLTMLADCRRKIRRPAEVVTHCLPQRFVQTFSGQTSQRTQPNQECTPNRRRLARARFPRSFSCARACVSASLTDWQSWQRTEMRAPWNAMPHWMQTFGTGQESGIGEGLPERISRYRPSKENGISAYAFQPY